MYVPAEPPLAPSLFFGSSRASLGDLVAPWHPSQVVGFGSCNAALWGALRALRIPVGDSILVPAYLFRSVLGPAKALGIGCHFYEIGPDLAPDLNRIDLQIDSRTRAVLLVHYFGFPGPAAALRDLCDRRGVALIEDCAHAMFGSIGGRPLGSFGHLSVFSLKKSFPVPGGGVLVINEPSWRFAETRHQPNPLETLHLLGLRAVNYAETMVGHSVKTALLSSHAYRRRLARRPKVNPVDYATELSELSRALAARVDPQQVVQARRAAYQYLEHSLASVDGARPIFPSLPPGVSPFCFPMYVDDRDSLQDWLLRLGIHARVYWDVAELPDGAVDIYPSIRSIVDRILILPTHQGLTPRHWSATASAVRSFSATKPSGYPQSAGPASSN